MPSATDDAAMTDTTTVIDQYNAAFLNPGNIREPLERAPEKLVDLIADDCVMEGTGPAPDGNRWTGYRRMPRRLAATGLGSRHPVLGRTRRRRR